MCNYRGVTDTGYYVTSIRWLTCLYSLWCVGHGKADKIATGQREESHDGSESSIMGEINGKVVAALDITEHQQRDEHHPGDN